MDYSYASKNYEKIIKQRNIALIAGVALLAADLLLATSLMIMKKEVIMVPGIVQEYRIAGSRVSSSYLEEMTHMFLSALLDLSPESVAYKKDLVLKYTLAGNIKAISDYFADAQNQHEKFGFSTYFSVKTLDIFPETMEVIANGILSSRFGKSGSEEKEAEYRLRYQMTGGVLRLKSFTMLNQPEDRAGIQHSRRNYRKISGQNSKQIIKERESDND